ncbi:MAG: hypothetical protein ACREIP_18985 [Alphaproteobacteria bacterium]
MARSRWTIPSGDLLGNERGKRWAVIRQVNRVTKMAKPALGKSAGSIDGMEVLAPGHAIAVSVDRPPTRSPPLRLWNDGIRRFGAPPLDVPPGRRRAARAAWGAECEGPFGLRCDVIGFVSQKKLERHESVPPSGRKAREADTGEIPIIEAISQGRPDQRDRSKGNAPAYMFVGTYSRYARELCVRAEFVPWGAVRGRRGALNANVVASRDLAGLKLRLKSLHAVVILPLGRELA